MFTEDLSVQIKFIFVQISSNGFGICNLGPSLAHLMHTMLKLVAFGKLYVYQNMKTNKLNYNTKVYIFTRGISQAIPTQYLVILP